MSHFVEEILHEYPRIVKKKSWRKDVFYRIRVVKRKVDGIMRPMVDIREFLVSEKKSLFTESGVYFTREDLGLLIESLRDAKKKYFTETTSPIA